MSNRRSKIKRAYNMRVDLKYTLRLGGIRNHLAHLRLLSLMHRYHVQSAQKGRPCVIEATPEPAEWLDGL